MPLGLALAWTPMGTEWLSVHILMTVVILMQATYVSTPGMEAAGISLGQTLTAKLQAIILVILCP